MTKINSQEQFNKLCKSISTRAKSYNGTVQDAANYAHAQANEHGNYDAAKQLLNTLRMAKRYTDAKAIARLLEEHGKYVITQSRKTGYIVKKGTAGEWLALPDFTTYKADIVPTVPTWEACVKSGETLAKKIGNLSLDEQQIAARQVINQMNDVINGSNLSEVA